jgi:ubiquinone/menaquinone biosynthesis C-methylase UbiE
MNHNNCRKLAEIFTDTKQHKTITTIICAHSTNKLDIRNVALNGLQLKNSRVVLDIGCGFGFFTLALKDRLNPGSNILGIDFCAKYKTPYLESCKIAGLRSKFFGLDEKAIKTIPANSVDLVICSYALYFFPTIISDISRLLKPSGVFVIITHSENHLKEIVAFLRETFDILGIKNPDLFPFQALIDNFNNKNGYRLLSLWFGQVEEKEYCNSLCFEINNFKDLEKYLKFKQPYYIPDYLENKNIIFNKIISRLREHLQSGGPFSITKDDTIFICKEPLSG